MQSLGLACALTLLILVLVNLTLVPSILLTFPNFFANCVQPMTICGFTFDWGSYDENGKTVSENMSKRTSNFVHVQDPFAPPQVLPEDGDYGSVRTIEDIREIHDNGHSLHLSQGKLLNQSILQHTEVVTSKFWHALGKINLTFPYNLLILVVVLGCVLPIMIPYSYNYRSSDGVDMMMPYNSPFTDAFQKMVDIFGYGRVFPYTMLLIPKYNHSANSVFTEQFFNESAEICNELVVHLGYNISRYGLSVISG
jgi:uncharacterized membrane protein YdfJ with MMPL/SSD domain